MHKNINNSKITKNKHQYLKYPLYNIAHLIWLKVSKPSNIQLGKSRVSWESFFVCLSYYPIKMYCFICFFFVCLNHFCFEEASGWPVQLAVQFDNWRDQLENNKISAHFHLSVKVFQQACPCCQFLGFTISDPCRCHLHKDWLQNNNQDWYKHKLKHKYKTNTAGSCTETKNRN